MGPKLVHFENIFNHLQEIGPSFESQCRRHTYVRKGWMSWNHVCPPSGVHAQEKFIEPVACDVALMEYRLWRRMTEHVRGT